MNRLIVVFWLICVSTPALAASVFNVDRVFVDTQAPSATEAREIAVRDGQREALTIVLQRLTPEINWPQLPVASTLAVENLVEGFQVSKEKTTTNRYLAELSVQFKADDVLALLRGQNIAVTTSQNRPALLLAVLEDAQGLQLWGEHWWESAWKQEDLANNPAPLVTPLGDLDDTIIATPEDILIGSPEKLDQLNRRYGTQASIVAHALADIDGQLGVTVYIFGANESDVIVRTYRSNQPHAEMAAIATGEILKLLSERWKQSAGVVSDQVNELRVRANYGALEAWTAIRKILRGSDLVQKLSVIEMSVNYAYLDIAYIGSISQLTANLEQAGLQINETMNGWQISTIMEPQS